MMAGKEQKLFDISIPGNEIPEWFSCRSDEDSVKIGLPSNWLDDEFMGIAICGVFTVDHKDLDGINLAYGCMDIIGNRYHFSSGPRRFTTFESDHLWLIYIPRELFEHHRSLTSESSHELFERLSSHELFERLSSHELLERHRAMASSHFHHVASLHMFPLEHDKYDSTNSVLVSTSTCIHAQFEVSDLDTKYYKKSKQSKSAGIRLVYKRDIECSEDDILPATDASILYQHHHHNCSTPPFDIKGNSNGQFYKPMETEYEFRRLEYDYDNNYRRSFSSCY